MANTFDCPKCGAPLDYDGISVMVSCPYCSSSVIVPESLRPKPGAAMDDMFGDAQVLAEIMADLQAGRTINAIKKYRDLTGVGLAEAKAAVENLAATGQLTTINIGDVGMGRMQPQPSSGSGGWLAVMVVVVLVILGFGLLVNFNALGLRDQLGPFPWDPTPIPPTPTPLPSPTPVARLALAFGQTGSGPGYFADARTLAVDPAGRVFVGDYSPARIQAFNADGTFLWQYIIPDESDFIGPLVADLQGRLYVEVGRNIYVFDAEHGELLAQWEPAPQQIGWYRAIAVTPKNEVLAVTERELVKLDAEGNLLLQAGGLEEDFLKQIGGAESSVTITSLAVDGTETIYIGTNGNFLLKLDTNGNLIDRINVEDEDESANSIAVDGRGRIAWAYSDRVIMTDSNGKFLSEFNASSLNDIEFNLRGQLLGISRTSQQVEVYGFGN